MRLRYAYNTNGLQSHRLEDALELLGELGYHGVGLTLDHMHLDPLRAGPGEVGRVKRLLQQHRLACVVETGARFLLDPRRKHLPALVSQDPLARMRRVDLLLRSLEVAAGLGAEALSLASGPLEPGQDPEVAWRFLVEGVREVAQKAHELEVRLSFEPEPGHLLDTLAGWRALRDDVPDLLLTLDVSHVSVAAPEGSVVEAIRAHAEWLGVVHLEDCPRGRHEHLPFGEGDLDLPPVLAALREARFGGLCAVELSRHSHAAHELTRTTLEALRAAERAQARPSGPGAGTAT